MSAVCLRAGLRAEPATTRTGRYELGSTQMVSEMGLDGLLTSLIASIPSTSCRPASVSVPQETAVRSDLATVDGSELAGRPMPGNPNRSSSGKVTIPGPQPCAVGRLAAGNATAGAGRPSPGTRAQVRVE